MNIFCGSSFLIFFILFLRGTFGQDADCRQTVRDTCSDVVEGKNLDAQCTALIGGFSTLKDDVKKLANTKIESSMKYFFMASYFTRWDINRKGFHSYFSKLSDETWSEGIEMIKYILKRGGSLTTPLTIGVKKDDKDTQELEGLGLALDNEKMVFKEQQKIITKAGKPGQEDGELSHYLSDNLSDGGVKRIRNLANHILTLSAAVTDPATKNLALFIYDTEIVNN